MNQLPFPSKLLDANQVEALTTPIEEFENNTWHDGVPSVVLMAHDVSVGLAASGTYRAYSHQIADFLIEMHQISLPKATELVSLIAKAAGMIRFVDDNGLIFYVLPQIIKLES